MKSLVTLALGITLAAALGCESKSSPGGPGATPGGGRGNAGLTQQENIFRLTVPMTETDIKQGESKVVKVGISRNKNFDQDVKLEFSGAPKGVTVKPSSNELKANVEDVQVTLEAAQDAALGEHTITVKGTPATSGAATSTTFKIQINKAG